MGWSGQWKIPSFVFFHDHIRLFACFFSSSITDGGDDGVKIMRNWLYLNSLDSVMSIRFRLCKFTPQESCAELNKFKLNGSWPMTIESIIIVSIWNRKNHINEHSFYSKKNDDCLWFVYKNFFYINLFILVMVHQTHFSKLNFLYGQLRNCNGDFDES